MTLSQHERAKKGAEMNHERSMERKIKALELRKKGASYPQIAQLLDYASAGAAWNAVKSLRAETTAETAAEATGLETERLDSYLAKLDPIIATGTNKEKIAAIVTATKVSERRAKLLGLDDYEARMAAATERQVNLNEAQALMMATMAANLIAKLELSPEQAELAAEIVEAELKQITD